MRGINKAIFLIFLVIFSGFSLRFLKEYGWVENNYRYFDFKRVGMAGPFHFIPNKMYLLNNTERYMELTNTNTEADVALRGGEICLYSRYYPNANISYRCAQYYYLAGKYGDLEAQWKIISNLYRDRYPSMRKEFSRWLAAR